MPFEDIIEQLVAEGVNVAGSIIDIPSVTGGVFIPVHVSRGSDGSYKPTRSTFVEVKARLEALGYLPEFLFINEGMEGAEQSLRSSLLVSFPDLIRNVFLSVSSSTSDVWIDQKVQLSSEQRSRITEHVERFVELFRLPEASVLSLGDIALPTRFELLSVVRVMAPVGCEALSEALLNKGLTVPSLDWINRQFDNLRKSGLVVRRSDRTYALTLEATRRLGTSKNKRSPDVRRLLALAKGGV